MLIRFIHLVLNKKKKEKSRDLKTIGIEKYSLDD